MTDPTRFGGLLPSGSFRPGPARKNLIGTLGEFQALGGQADVKGGSLEKTAVPSNLVAVVPGLPDAVRYQRVGHRCLVGIDCDPGLRLGGLTTHSLGIG